MIAMEPTPSDNQISFIRDLYKGESEERIQGAEENFKEYLLLIKRICLRLEREEEEAAAEFDESNSQS